MAGRGEPAAAGRQRNGRLGALAKRVYPDVPVLPLEEAVRRRNERRLSALGIARSRGPECPVEPLDVGEAGAGAGAPGVQGPRRGAAPLPGHPVSRPAPPAPPPPPPPRPPQTPAPPVR